jgi:hypothetical protein
MRSADSFLCDTPFERPAFKDDTQQVLAGPAWAYAPQKPRLYGPLLNRSRTLYSKEIARVAHDLRMVPCRACIYSVSDCGRSACSYGHGVCTVAFVAIGVSDRLFPFI